MVELHDQVLHRCGVPWSPLIDRSLLDSAINRAKSLAYYEAADLARQGVAIAIGISQAQAFADGNKRTAFAALDVFLRINGLEYQGEPMELARWFESIALSERGHREEMEIQFTEWIRSHLTSSPHHPNS